ncbi:hypothetical protein K0M31_015748 [Melipona bicolor]|uniref:Uncharacterized protein n=1 Tax=Melipona bicolor TaxID=60889 RepID=A0AA40FF13_9HYME|nr:hypothetical protein K0M31_015748 [Melipona bicolor]
MSTDEKETVEDRWISGSAFGPEFSKRGVESSFQEYTLRFDISQCSFLIISATQIHQSMVYLVAKVERRTRKGKKANVTGGERKKRDRQTSRTFIPRSVQVQGYEVHPVWDQSQGSAAS